MQTRDTPETKHLCLSLDDLRLGFGKKDNEISFSFTFLWKRRRFCSIGCSPNGSSPRRGSLRYCPSWLPWWRRKGWDCIDFGSRWRLSEEGGTDGDAWGAGEGGFEGVIIALDVEPIGEGHLSASRDGYAVWVRFGLPEATWRALGLGHLENWEWAV